jgi:hypothetical protein
MDTWLKHVCSITNSSKIRVEHFAFVRNTNCYFFKKGHLNDIIFRFDLGVTQELKCRGGGGFKNPWCIALKKENERQSKRVQKDNVMKSIQIKQTI